MSVFISYARSDESIVQDLARDVARTRHEVWIDQQLTGGQSWWDTILEEVRRCDVFLIALSPTSVKSKACGLELGYAIALRKTILPVMVRDVEIALAPDIVANSQVIRYTSRTADAALDLANALAAASVSPPLPEVMPIPPPVPMTYLGELQTRVIAPALSPAEQHALAGELRVHALVDETRTGALQLLHDLRHRPDIIEAVGREIDQLLARSTTAPAPVTPLATPGPAAGWFPDPYGRFDLRYWDGTEWTGHVARGGRQSVDPPIAVPAPPGPTVSPPTFVGAQAHTAAGTVARWDTTEFIVMLLGTASCLGIPCLVLGFLNLKHEARRNQAMALLAVGGLATLFYAFVLGAGLSGTESS